MIQKRLTDLVFSWLALVVTLCFACDLAFAQTCKGAATRKACINDGDMPRAHRLGQFMFDTNSHIEKGSLWHYDVCIENRDPKLDLQYAWFVHNMEGWLPPNEPRESCHHSDEP